MSPTEDDEDESLFELPPSLWDRLDRQSEILYDNWRDNEPVDE